MRIPSVLGCALLLVFVRVSLRVLGLGRSLRAAGWLVRDIRTHVDTAPDAVAGAVEAVAIAAAFFPGRAICLEQSLALYILGRRRGLPLTLRLGVQPYPFNAHAWVEYEGQPINDDYDHVRQFVPMPDFAQ